MKPTRVLMLALALPLIFALQLPFQAARIRPLPESQPEIVKLSSTLWSELRDIDFDQARAYCLFYDGLTVVDLGNINAPSLMGQVELPKDGLKVDISDDYAYVVSADSLMHVIDITSLNQPSLTHSFKASDNLRDIQVRDNCAYVAAQDSGLLVLDVSDPVSTSLIGSCDVTGFHPLSLDLRGNVAYLAGTGGLRLINVLFPYLPYLIGSSDVVPGANRVLVGAKSGRTYAYLGNPAQLSILDVSDPEDIFTVSSHAPESAIADISVAGDYAYLGLDHEGLLVLDITERNSPQEISALRLGDYPTGVYFHSDFAFLSHLFDPISIVNVFNPDRPFVSGRWIIPGTCKDAAVKDSFAYVICDRSGLHILDVGDPEHPQPAGTVYAPYNNNGVDIEGDYAYITALLTGMQVVDVSDPHHPEVVGNYRPQGYTYGVEAADGYAYLLNAENDIQIMDIGNPLDLIPRGSVETPGSAQDLAPVGDYLYAADGSAGLTIINVSDKDDPFPVTSIPTGGTCANLFCSGNRLFISSDEVGMQIYGITDPENPDSQSVYPASGEIEDLYVEDGYAYLSMANGGIQVVDVSSSPFHVAAYDLLDDPGTLVIEDQRIYLCDYRSFKILRFLPAGRLPQSKSEEDVVR
jgi:hypothetical protein